MKIQVEVEIFDDPIYCNDAFDMGNSQESCERLFGHCEIFKKRCKFNAELRRHEKCDACKKAYQEAKLNEYSEQYYQEAEFGEKE